MKQAEDKVTMDMWADEPVPASKRYRFYIRLTNGEEVEWTGLTKKQARDMYAYTDKTMPSNVTRCGWEEI